MMANRMRLARMTGTQALQAVVKPGAALVTDEVACKIVEFVAGARGGSIERLAELNVEPALLSVVCRELNERRRSLGQAQITADLVSGNRREILTDFYERSVNDLPAGMRSFVEDRLLTKSGFRDNLALESALEFPDVTQPLIDTLVSRRLLRIEDRAGIQRVELTHDVLAEVIRASRDTRQQRLALEAAEKQRRLDLAAAARQTRRQRFLIGGLTLAVIALSIGAVFGLRAQRRAAALAGEAELATGSRLLDEGQTGDGLAYLAAAARRDQGNSVAATRIVSTLAARNFLLPVGSSLTLPSPATQALILADGRSALVQCEDNRVRVIDLAEWKVAREFSFDQKIQPQGVRVAAKNSDVFAVAFADGTVQVCDTATGRPRGKTITPPNLVESYQTPGFQLGTWRTYFALSPDGRWLMTFRATTAVFDTATGEERFHGEHFNHTMPTDFATFNPFSADSSRLAIPFWEFAGARASGGDSKKVKSTSVLLSVPDGKVLIARQLEDPNHADGAKNFSADGTRVLMLRWIGTGTNKDDNNRTPAAVVCDARTLEPIGLAITFSTTSSSNEIFLTPDGNRVVMNLSGERAARVYDVKTGQLAFPALPHSATFTSIGVSDDGAIYATNSIDGQIRLWDLRTGTLFAEPSLKLDRRGAAALSRDGRTVLVFSATGAAYRLEVTRSPAAPLALPRPTGAAFSVNFAEKAPARALYFPALRSRCSMSLRGGRSMAVLRCRRESPELPSGISVPLCAPARSGSPAPPRREGPFGRGAKAVRPVKLPSLRPFPAPQPQLPCSAQPETWRLSAVRTSPVHHSRPSRSGIFVPARKSRRSPPGRCR
jgi:DNA-binding beta-propeller fold protein YncE